MGHEARTRREAQPADGTDRRLRQKYQPAPFWGTRLRGLSLSTVNCLMSQSLSTSHKSAVSGHCVLIQYPSFIWIPGMVDPYKIPPKKWNFPSCEPPSHSKIQHLGVKWIRNVKKRKSEWLVSYHDTPPRSQPKPHLLLKHSPECHWRTSPHRLYFSDFANLYHKHYKIIVTDNNWWTPCNHQNKDPCKRLSHKVWSLKWCILLG